MKIIFKDNYWKVDFCDYGTAYYELVRNFTLKPNESEFEGYYYPIYLPIGMLINFAKEKGFNLEIIY